MDMLKIATDKFVAYFVWQHVETALLVHVLCFMPFSRR